MSGRKLRVYPMREVDPRCCATCRYHDWGNGYWYCLRSGDANTAALGGDTGDRGDIQHVCDGWKSRIRHGQYPGDA